MTRPAASEIATPKVREVRREADSPWITIKEAAAYLGVGVDTIYDACACRGLKHVKLGHSTIRLRREWVDEWAESLVRYGVVPLTARDGRLIGARRDRKTT